MNAVREIQDSNWKSAGSDLQAGGSGPTAAPAASEPETEDRYGENPTPGSKGAPEVAGMMFKPKSWNKARRYVIKTDADPTRTTSNCIWTGAPVRYWIVVSNSKRSNEQVLRIAQGRGNQENLIKDRPAKAGAFSGG